MGGDTWSRWVVDAAVAVAFVELVVALIRSRRAGAPWHERVPNLAAGLFLMLGMRIALDGAAWPWLAACLTGAGVAHAIDASRRRR